jgi:hypothetical protein
MMVSLKYGLSLCTRKVIGVVMMRKFGFVMLNVGLFYKRE